MHRELTEIKEKVAKLANDVRWMKWIGAATAAAVFMPKVGGPNLPHAVAQAVAHLVA